MERIETVEFKWPASRLLKRSIGVFAARWWWALALPFVACFIAGCYDWRWMMVALMLLLVVFPGIMMMAYYSIALTPENALAVIPQKAVFTPSDISIIYGQITEDAKTPKPTRIDIADVESVMVDGDTLKIKTHKRTIEVPTPAFANAEDIKRVISWLPEAQEMRARGDF